MPARIKLKSSKYRSRRTIVDGITFHSAKEAARYVELRSMAGVGEISGLACQPRFALTVGESKIGDYVADFEYLWKGERIIEDVKGFKTPLYKWKRKHFEAQYGINITET